VKRVQFFRDVTLRLCSSLDLQTSVQRAFPVLAEAFPIDHVFVDVLDPSLGAIRRIAHVKAHERGSGGAPAIIPLPRRLLRFVESLQGPVLLNDLRDEDARRFQKLVRLEGNSDLALVLRIEGRHLGFLVLRAAGAGRFSKAHADLLASIADPFAIALSNTLAHRELIKRKDDLLDDKRFLNRMLFPTTADDVIGADTGLRDVMDLVRRGARGRSSR